MSNRYTQLILSVLLVGAGVFACLHYYDNGIAQKNVDDTDQLALANTITDQNIQQNNSLPNSTPTENSKLTPKESKLPTGQETENSASGLSPQAGSPREIPPKADQVSPGISPGDPLIKGGFKVLGGGGGSGTPTVVHSASVSTASTPASLTVTSTTAGDIMICGVTWYSTNTVTQVKDSNNDIFSPLTASAAGGGATTAQIFYYPNIPAGVTSVTVTWSGGNGGAGIFCHEVSGIAVSNPLDVQSTGAGASGTTESVTGTTSTNANDYFFAVVESNNGGQTFLGQNGFSPTPIQALNDGNNDGASLDQIVSATQSVGTISTSGETAGWAAAFGAFKVAGGSGGNVKFR